jgi:diguanylate cyclase (GGDEF)-like protein/PAS domain S-box-containing protein
VKTTPMGGRQAGGLADTWCGEPMPHRTRRQTDNGQHAPGRLAALQSSCPDAIIGTTLDGRVTSWNPAAEQQYGFRHAEIIGRAISTIVPPDQQPELLDLLRRLGAGERVEHLQTVRRRRDGHDIVVAVSATGVRDRAGLIVEAVVVEHDLTADLNAQAALDLAHARLRRLVESNLVGVVFFDAAGTIYEANDYYLELLGCTREELLSGRVSWREATPEEHLANFDRAIEQMRERGVCAPYEKEYIRADGSRVWVLVADTILPGSSEVFAAFVIDITDRKRTEAALADQVLHDGLTGLPNRTLLRNALQQATDAGQGFVLGIIDLDGFKEVNDRLGHEAGDELLRDVAARLSTSLDGSGTLVARLGGDEFAVLLPTMTLDSAMPIVERLRGAMGLGFEVAGRRLEITMSLGLSLFPEHGQTGASLLRRADLAMYAAKRERRGVSVYQPRLEPTNAA